MIKLRRKICREAGCNTLIDCTETYCGKHKRDKIKPFENAVRYNEELYNTARWRNLRKAILNDFPNCSICGISKDETILEIHHIKPPIGNEELFFDIANLMPVCKKCHRIHTAREINHRQK